MRELLVIDGVTIEGSLLRRNFACDLLKCKGACCSLPGGRGAPLLDSEIEEIQKTLPAVLPILDDRKRALVESRRNGSGPVGFYEGESGDYATTCVDDADCVFVYHDNGIAKCAIERAYNEGKVSFRKPISCHLYPIRVRSFGGDVLRYHEIAECRPAAMKGDSEKTGVIEFLKDALTRRYGEEWYNKLDVQVHAAVVDKL